MKYRKKPVVIEAWKFTCYKDLINAPRWVIGAMRIPSTTESILIETLEGTYEAKPGDMIIQGVKGEVYPCKPEIFAMTYDLVEEEMEHAQIYPEDFSTNEADETSPQ